MPKDFLWGVATASFQVEGAAREEGRGQSIWDTFCRTPGKVLHQHNGDVACDQFHRYKEDVRLMKELGAQSYRFSIAWPRIFPDARGKMNPKGFDYYHRLIDELLANDIMPAATLYHWDLPQYLADDYNGWAGRETAFAFEEYSAECFKALGDKVKFWITLNEPWCSAFLGYSIGVHAPGHSDQQEFYNSVHHLNLAHGLAVQQFRKGGYEGQIGTTLNLGAARPATQSPADIAAFERSIDFNSRIYAEPLFKGSYPQEFVQRLKEKEGLSFPIEDGDMQIIHQKCDFLGINYYQEGAIADAPGEGLLELKGVPVHSPRTDFDWPITPMGMYRILFWVKEEYGDIPLYITENGCAYDDVLDSEGKACHDPQRVDFYREHFKAAYKAVEDGANLKGYYAWSLIDNFEWAVGYTKRFGLIYCDFLDQRRIPKSSYHYYREVIAGYEDLS